VVTIALVVVLVPVLVIVRNAAENELRARLEEQLNAASTALADDLLAGQQPDLDALTGLIPAGDGIRLEGPDGTVVAERNTDDISSPISATAEGPGGTTIALITSADELNDRFVDQVLQLLLIAAIAILAAAALAAVQARQLARPLERLARSAGRLGDGDFTVAAPPPSGIQEIDDIARALRLSASRVDRMLESERAFTADATHQLRTGLTAIAMRLELLERNGDATVAADARATLEQTDELNSTIDELLKVARRGSTGERTELDLVELVDHHVADWQARFAKHRRQIVVTTGETDAVIGTAGLVGQILNILFENGLRHGAGTLAVLIAAESVTVEDDGAGISERSVATLFDRPTDHRAEHGRGLPLARRLAESDGGRLDLVQARPPAFRLTLVAARH
jgi:signal transduction histidine kinase